MKMTNIKQLKIKNLKLSLHPTLKTVTKEDHIKLTSYADSLTQIQIDIILSHLTFHLTEIEGKLHFLTVQPLFLTLLAEGCLNPEKKVHVMIYKFKNENECEQFIVNAALIIPAISYPLTPTAKDIVNRAESVAQICTKNKIDKKRLSELMQRDSSILSKK